MIHIIPLDDRLPHDHSAECLCDPSVECIHPEHNLPHDTPVCIHNSFDGREEKERRGEKTAKQWACYGEEAD